VLGEGPRGIPPSGRRRPAQVASTKYGLYSRAIHAEGEGGEAMKVPKAPQGPERESEGYSIPERGKVGPMPCVFGLSSFGRFGY